MPSESMTAVLGLNLPVLFVDIGWAHDSPREVPIRDSAPCCIFLQDAPDGAELSARDAQGGVANADSDARRRRTRDSAVWLPQFRRPDWSDSTHCVPGHNHDRQVLERRAAVAGPGHGVDVVFPGRHPARPGFGLCRRYQLGAGGMPDDLDGRVGQHVCASSVASGRQR